MELSAMLERLAAVEAAALVALQKCSDASALQALRRDILGKKGDLAALLRAMRELDAAERPGFGAEVNQVKARLESAFTAKEEADEGARRARDLAGRRLDLTLPGRGQWVGAEHPLRRVQRRIEDVFIRMGFDLAHGPLAELDYFNFEALNFPVDHPARDMQDTLMLENGRVLRTHTSPVQIRTMLAYAPPIRIIAPGAVFRRDDDITHSPMFFQVEGLHIDRHLHLGHLKGILGHFVAEFFGDDIGIRLRPSFFPFTEPSVEVDIGCIFCKRAGCRICKQTGWLEICGAGMVDPNVLAEVGLDPEEWGGWAFGVGVERVAMLLYGVSDIRLFYESDQRFLSQFA